VLSVDSTAIGSIGGHTVLTAQLESTSVTKVKEGAPLPGDSAGTPLPPDDSQRAGGVRAQPPRELLDFRYPAVSGRTIRVDAGDNLQSALNNARRGDEIVLAAGATWQGNFVLPARGDSGWVVIRGEHASRLPAMGTRVGPADGAYMPKIATPNTRAAIITAQGARGWWLTGIELTVLPSVNVQQYGIVWLGDGGSSQASLATVPGDIVLDRMYIHGQPTTNMSRCIALNSARTQISDSYITDCHGKGFDSQAILGWNGPGPYKIVNNLLAGAGENVMFGGADPAIPGLVPSDIEIRRNHFYTPWSWKGVWTKKNLLELKNAARVLIEGNVFEGSWVDGQTGWAVMFRSANQEGRCRWCRTTDVIFRLNYVTNVAGGIAFIGGGGNVDTTARRIHVVDNVFDAVGVAPYTGEQRGFIFNEGPADVAIERTVLVGDLNLLIWFDPHRPTRGLTLRDNVLSRGRYGISTDGTTQGTPSLTAAAPGYSWANMTLIGGAVGTYPASTTFVSAESQARTATTVRALVRNATAGVVVP
jgi:hypothetical protein